MESSIQESKPIATVSQTSILARQHRSWLSFPVSPRLRITNFNLLADSNIKPDHFGEREIESLAMSGRFHLIVEEAKAVDPDILCCQEVDEEVVENLRTALSFTSDEVD